MVVVVALQAQANNRIKGLRDLGGFLTGLLGLTDILAPLSGEVDSHPGSRIEMAPITIPKKLDVKPIEDILIFNPKLGAWLLGLH